MTRPILGFGDAPQVVVQATKQPRTLLGDPSGELGRRGRLCVFGNGWTAPIRL
jgi:hypothetical protein